MSKNKNHELDKARFDEPFFKNYDLYDTDGKTGPGTGLYQHMSEYKSVADFLKKKRKRKSKKASLRIKILKSLMKQAIDFPIDESFKDPIQLEENNSIQTALPMGGMSDEYLPENDQEDKMPTALNFGEDYQDDGKEEETIEDFLEKVKPSESPLLGLPDGMNPEDETADKTLSNRSQDYGTTDSGNTLYDNVSF
jgi:hypothetical protein